MKTYDSSIDLSVSKDEVSSFVRNNDARRYSTSSRSDSLEKKKGNKLKQVREKAGRLINSTQVQYFIMALILTNAIMMGIATFDFISKNEDAAKAFETVDEVFLIIFTVEAGIQVFYEGLNTYKNAWLVFDLSVVFASWSLNGVQVIRSVRVFRALRLITRLKGMRQLIEALAKTLPRMAGITALLGLIIYIFSVMFTEFFREDYENGQMEYPYFARLDSAFLTSFQIMTFDNWAEIVRDVMAVKSWGWIPLVAFVLITGFMVIHLVVAVICDALADLDDEDKEKLTIAHIFKDILPENEDLDGDSPEEYSETENANSAEITGVQDQISRLENQVLELISANERTMYWLEQITEKVDSMNDWDLQ